MRRQRSLDGIIDQLGKKKAAQQPPDLRIILQICLYQLRYLNQIPDSAAVNTSVELTKENGYPKPGSVVNGILRAYGREADHRDPLQLPADLQGKRLKKLTENCRRLGLKSMKIRTGDSRSCSEFTNIVDRVLIDAPCSGLGTLHKRPDIRWRKTSTKVQEFSRLQRELLAQGATWVKPGGILVYPTCTLHTLENQETIRWFLDSHPDWPIQPPEGGEVTAPFATKEGWLEIWPHQQPIDVFYG